MYAASSTILKWPTSKPRCTGDRPYLSQLGVGFPKGLGVGARFSPLTLQTFAASGLFSHRRFDKAIDTPFFFLQDPSVGGYSGAPVYDVSIRNLGGAVVTGEGTRCYGLVHGTLGDETGGKLSAVVPIQAVLELLTQPTLP